VGAPYLRNSSLVPVAAYCSLNALVAQLKNCPFQVNIAIELKTITTNNNNNEINLKSLFSRQFQILKWRHIYKYIFFYKLCFLLVHQTQEQIV
jgi:hypothetical protein